MLYRIKKKCGSHSQNGRKFSPGDVIESETDLISQFPGKFEKAYDVEASEGKVDTATKIKKPNIPNPKNLALLDRDNDRHKGGVIVENIKTPPLSKSTSKQVQKEEDVKEEDFEEDEEDTVEEVATIDLATMGEDITADFPEAEEIGLRVYEDKKRWCNVLDTADNTVLNEKKLRKIHVAAFLKQYLAD